MSQPAISSHLRVLREAGVVIGTREGRWIFYRLNSEAFDAIAEWLKIKQRLRDIIPKPELTLGAEGRTRTGTPSLTADFEFLQGIFRQFGFRLNIIAKICCILLVLSQFLTVHFVPSRPMPFWHCVFKNVQTFHKKASNSKQTSADLLYSIIFSSPSSVDTQQHKHQ